MKTVNLSLLIVMMLACAPAFAQVDFSGEWAVRNHEDPGQPPLGDYLGIPFNQAGRVRGAAVALATGMAWVAHGSSKWLVRSRAALPPITSSTGDRWIA